MSNHKLKHVLTCEQTAVLRLDVMRAEDMKRAGKFWLGSAIANKMRKDDIQQALTDVLNDKKRMPERLCTLPDNQRQVVGIFQRYGGAVSGTVLLNELLARNLVEKDMTKASDWRHRRETDPVQSLRDKLVLISKHGSPYYGYHHSGMRRAYPNLILPNKMRGLIEPATQLPWKPSKAAADPIVVYQRSAAAATLELCSFAETLDQLSPWKTLRDGSFAKTVLNKLIKIFPDDDCDPLQPPEQPALYCELLRGIGAITANDGSGWIDRSKIENQMRQSPAEQAWHWVRAWMKSTLWHDGVGAVTERDSYDGSEKLLNARELLVWALCRVAHGSEKWLDLETFLIDLWSIEEDDSFSHYHYDFFWRPKFAAAADRINIPYGPQRKRAYWLDGTGTFMANALCGTLVHLGLVQRGGESPNFEQAACFRLTPLGKTVFGAPELSEVQTKGSPKFLTVQPNFEIMAYLDSAEAGAIWPLIQMSKPASSSTGPVQTFKLTQETIYHALESGLTLEDIGQFLTLHSRNDLPANVLQSVAEWSRKRESLTLRSNISLAIVPSNKTQFTDFAGARPIGENYLLLPATTSYKSRHWTVVDHAALHINAWQADDEGNLLELPKADLLTQTRLNQFAERNGANWKITAKSTGQARDRGIPAHQILEWLGLHLVNELSPILQTAIRNWCKPAKVFCDKLVMLQIPDAQACAAVRESRQFEQCFLEHIPPNWFIVRPEKHDELKKHLEEHGFSTHGSVQLTAQPKQTAGARGSRRRKA